MKKIITYFSVIFTMACIPAFGQYQINGNASDLGGGCYELTPNIGAQAGSVWNTNVISLSQPFDFTFNVFLGCDDAGADGICFGLQPLGTTIGSSGNGMGMGGVSPSLGIFIDTYQNISPDNDPAYDHISMNANGDVNHTTANNLAGPVQASDVSADIEDCSYHTMRVQWDPVTQTYQVWIDGVLRLSYTGDIINTIFGGNPNVYWGFTGSTGGLTNEQSFCILMAANFAAPPVCAGTVTTFTDQSNSGSTVTNWSWDFGDGTPVFSGSTAATFQNPTHTYAAAGTYNALETISSSAGSSTISHTVIVLPPPSVTASGGTSLCSSQTINLSGTVSGPSNTPLSFTSTGSNSNVAIADNGVPFGWTGTGGTFATSNIPVTGLNAGWSLTSITFNITHTFDGDLIGYLFDPCGNSIQLISSTGGAGDNFTNTTFTPGATTGIGTATAPFNGTFVPMGGAAAWNAFITASASCASANGTWSFHVGDKAGADVGTIVNWSIIFSNPTSPTYVWAPTAGMTNSTTLNPSVTPTATTTYTLTASNSLGCSSTATTTITITPGPSLAITNPAAVCAPGFVDLTLPAVTAGSTGGGTLSYYTDNTATTPLTSPNAVTTSGTYYITTSVGGGCSDTAAVTVTVSPAPTLTITNPAPVCAPNSIDLTAAAVTAGSTGSGTLSYYSDAAGTTPLPTPNAMTASGTYYIESAIGSCNDIEPVTITINPAPSLVITNPPAICGSGSIDLTAPAVTSGSTGSGTLTYYTDSTATTPLSSPNAVTTGGTYYIESTVGSCTDIKPVTVVISPAPTLAITNPAAVCAPGSIDLTAPAVTAGSTGGGTLAYYTDAAATTPLASPSAVTSSGTYYIQSTIGSCSDLAAVTVTVNPAPSLVVTNPAAVCGPASIDLTLPAVTAGSTGSGTLTYYTDAGATTTLSSPAAVTASGTYYIESTLGSCSDIEAVTVTINPTPSLVITNPAAVCGPASIDLTAAAVTAGSTGGGTLAYYTDASATTPLASPSAVTSSGTYYIQSSNGACADVDAVTVTINTTPSLVITSPAAICGPGSIDITTAAITAGSTGGGTLTYYTDAGATTTLASPTAVSTSGTYYIESTLGSCSDVAAVTVTINTTPSLTITNPAAVCAPASINLTSSAVTAGSTGAGTLSYWTNSTATSPLASPGTVTSSGTYYIQSSNGACSDLEPVTVVINAPPVANAGSDMTIACGTSSISLDGSGSSTGATITYNWTTTGGHILSGATTTAPAVDQSGVYTITVINTSTGCSANNTVNVTVTTTPVAAFTASPSSGTAPLIVNFTNNSTNATVYGWTFGDGTTSTLSDPNYTYMQTGDYQVCLIAANGACVDTSCTRIEVSKDFAFALPNIFTPNGDGSNDIFKPIIAEGITSFNGVIYDRWGLKLFEWNSVTSGWDGQTKSGAHSPDGTYYYIIKVAGSDAKEHEYTGYVTLLSEGK
ncbi:MAG: repeat-containing protein [Bacteroidetes bacterium]|nr:repeat-containing protein [Bacteroidota bacterium]